MTRRHTPLATLRARHEAELAAAVRAALEDGDWRPAEAARLLDTSPTAIYRIVGRDPALARDLEKRGHGPGAPKKRAESAA